LDGIGSKQLTQSMGLYGSRPLAAFTFRRRSTSRASLKPFRQSTEQRRFKLDALKPFHQSAAFETERGKLFWDILSFSTRRIEYVEAVAIRAAPKQANISWRCNLKNMRAMAARALPTPTFVPAHNLNNASSVTFLPLAVLIHEREFEAGEHSLKH
jgi:hypothetical protein